MSNTSERPGKEVVQVYRRDEVASIVRPPLRLVAFTTVELDPGRTMTVTLRIPPTRLATTGTPGDMASRMPDPSPSL